MLLFFVLCSISGALKHTQLGTLQIREATPDAGDTVVVGSQCLQSADFTGPSQYACQQPCKLPGDTVFYVGYKTTMEGSCADQRSVIPCPVQPPICDTAESSCIGAWGDWSTCDSTCGGGVQSRTRTLTGDCQLACWECSTQWRGCNQQPCGYDCELTSDWGEWSACSVSCYSGDAGFLATRHRYRNVLQGVSPGKLCSIDQYVQSQVCPNIGACPVDCVVSPWGDWSDCNVQCGCGHQSRERKITTAPSASGVQCPSLTQVQECHCDPCPRDCQLSEWSFGPCMGDCYQTVGGVKVYPSRRKSRYVIQEQIPFNGGCATPCQVEVTQTCTWLPPCDGQCQLTEWSAWTGNCTGCVPYGSMVPTQQRFRSITTYGTSSICECTQELRVCDLNWCCEDCKVSDWSAWGPCLGFSCAAGVSEGQGIQRRQRHVLSPNNPCGANCPTLTDTQTCRTCCPLDCKVGDWILDVNCGRPDANGVLQEVTCGSEPGIRKYHRTLTAGNSCGAPCPFNGSIEYKEEVCYPKLACCPVDCAMSEWTTSPCFGCGVLSVAWKSREITRTPACGGQSCCDLDCAKFVQVRCPNPTPCPQTPCVYGPFGEFDNCPLSCHAVGAPPNSQCRIAPLIEGPSDCPLNQTDCAECNGQCCPINCEVSEWQEWGACSSTCGHGLRSRFRTITTPQACTGAPCPTLQQFESCEQPECPVDCVISDWSFWTLCPSCAVVGATNASTRYRTILRQPSGVGAAACPADRTQVKPCPNTPCDRDCTVGEWGPWGPCSVLFGDGFQLRTRSIVQTKVGNGMDCPPLQETQWCYRPTTTCIVGPPVDGPCPVTCQVPGAPVPTFIRHRSGKPLIVANTSAVIETCPGQDEEVPCQLPCCPVDCVVEAWGPWSECIDGVKNRTRSIVSGPTCGGAACPVCYLEKDDCPYVPPTNECERGEACEDGFTTMIADS